jgi:hypothetical protein
VYVNSTELDRVVLDLERLGANADKTQAGL